MSERSTSRFLQPGILSGLLFFAITLFGCLYIVISKMRGFSPVLVTSVPVVIMLFYAGLMLFARLLRLRDDQAGDNLYYMGFLFTLTSLAVSLYQFSAAGSAEEIVQNFGIAIASTISGIALRILFHQMRRDPVEVEATARIELAEASRRVKRELDATVLEFTYFRRTTQQSLGETIEDMKKALAEMRESMGLAFSRLPSEISKPLEETSRRSSDIVDELAKRISTGLEEVSDRLVKNTDNFSARASATTQAMEKMAGRLAAMQTPEQVIEIKLAPTIQGLSRAVNSFSKGAEIHERTVNENLKRTQEIAAALVQLAEGLQNLEATRTQEATQTQAASTPAPWGGDVGAPRRIIE